VGEAIAFYTLAALILGFGVLVITARSTVHSVIFLVLNFLFVAALYVLLHAEFLAVIQVLVYAGGIVVLYLFVVMLVNLKRPPEVHMDPRRQARLGVGLAVAVLAMVIGMVIYGLRPFPPGEPAADTMAPPLAGNVEQVGWVLYIDYLIPFELASILLLVAMIGAIVLAKRQL
jgi:NADH-quinone oxidoreductase subunit J